MIRHSFSADPLVECHIYSSFSEIERLREKWDEFAASTGAPVYMSYDWCRTWWETYGWGRRLSIVLALVENEWAGLFPMYIDRLRLGPLKLGIARLVGANVPPKMFDPPARPEVATLALKAALHALLLEGSCDLVSFGPVRTEYPGIKDLVQSPGEGLHEYKLLPAGVVTFFDLSKEPEDFLTTLGKTEQRKRRYDFRYLGRHGVREAMVSGKGVDIDSEFGRFVAMHTDDWESKGRLGHFNAWPQALEYHAALTRRMSGLGRLRLLKLETDREAISYNYGYRFGDAYFGELLARLENDTWSKISLGTCSIIAQIQHALKDRAVRLYAGLGHYGYKARLGAQESELVILQAYSGAWANKAVVAMFSCWHKLLEVVYFKVWYMRVQPRLPKRLRKPIWKYWAKWAQR